MSSKAKKTGTKEDGKFALVPKVRFPEFREKRGWSETSVGRISDTVVAGGTPSTSERTFWGGDIRWMNSGELNNKRVSEVEGRITREGLKNSSTRIIPPRCILIGLAGQGKTRGTVAMNLVELCTNQSIAAIFPNNGSYDSDFLYHDLDKRYEELRRLSAGGEGRGGLNLQIIKSLKVLLPTLAEQQKIAECLSFADEVIAAQARKLDALKTHKKGLMQQLFPREGETQPRARFSEFTNEKEWEAKPLSAFCKIGDIDHKMPPSVADGIPYVMTGDFFGINGIDFECAKKISIKDYEQLSKKIKPEIGDIVIARYASVGAVRYIETNMKFLVSYSCAIIKCNRPDNSKFLYYFLQSDALQSKIGLEINMSSQKNIGIDSIKKLTILLPNLPEQQKVAGSLANLDALITAETQKLEALKLHKKGLMQQLFPATEEVET